MATLEQIIEEAEKLPVEERRRLRTVLETLESNGDAQPPYRTRERKRAWIVAHRDEYLGQWVAVEDDTLVAQGTNPRQVYLAAREAGIEVPYLGSRSEKSLTPEVGCDSHYSCHNPATKY